VQQFDEESIDDALAASLDLATQLGQRTAELHRALAATTPEPHPYSLLYQRGLLQGIRSELRETQRLLRRAVRRAGGEADLEIDADAVLARVDELRRRKLDAVRINVHGDLHLGQILWTGRDVVFIDFEGEPARALSERSIVRNPLVDVAGMVRSFDYAGRVALATELERGVLPASGHDAARELAGTWIRQVTDRFWAEYQSRAVPDGLVPADDTDRALLLDVFVTTKALYEVRYELANRPEWVRWPLAAVRGGSG